MTKSPAALLVIPGMPKKGDAVPAVESFEQPSPPSSLAPIPAPEPQHSRFGSRVLPTIAVTVRLGEARYERMKSWGMARRVSNQDVIVAALDLFFNLSEAEREHTLADVRR
jgi:hypothetical protein